MVSAHWSAPAHRPLSPAPWKTRCCWLLCMLFMLSACKESHRTPEGTSDEGWGTYNKTYDGQRYSDLDEINLQNVNQLKPVCRLEVGEDGAFQTGPVVVGDTMFITTPHTTIALNATNCTVYWRNVDTLTKDDVFAVNRGVAYLNGKLFRGTANSRLQAIDAATGKTLWDIAAGDPKVGEFLSSAPIAWNGIVFIGLAGSDWGIRGRIMGYDVATGKELWRFWTIPMGNDPGADTWKIPESAKRGGGGTWTSYALDAKTGELFVPVANPSPDYAPHVRPGDNLFTNSVVVLDAKTGKLKWWYQLTPNDGYDWDLGAAPLLHKGQDGSTRVVLGSKDGYVYSINRATQKLFFRTAVTTLSNPATPPTAEGIHVCPGALGGVEWNGPAYDPKSNNLFVAAVDWCGTAKLGDVTYNPPQLYMGTELTFDPDSASSGWVYALDAESGVPRWKFHSPSPIVAGVTPTNGGLVFTGDLKGTLYGFDKSNGNVAFEYNTGGSIAGGIVTYAVEGKQYLATTSGNVSRTFSTVQGKPSVIILTLNGGDENAGPNGRLVALPAVVLPSPAGADASPGQQVYAQFCVGCHGTHGEGGATGPSLAPAKEMGIQGIIAFVKNPKPPMPKLYPSPLSEEQVKAVAEYVMTLK